jgi:uncharacterized coiled-coil protein SlyX
MGKILKGIAIAAGVGVAVGLGATVTTRRGSPQRPRFRSRAVPARNADDSILRLEPLFDRFDRVEARLGVLESRPAQKAANAFPSVAIAEFDRRVAEQESALRALRVEIDQTGRHVAAQVEAAAVRSIQIRQEIPPVVEASLNRRLSDLEARLRQELDAKYRQNLQNLEKTIDQKLSERIAALEKTLAEQSASIAVLRKGAETADANLHRLIGSVERLCAASQLASAQPAAAQLPTPAPPAPGAIDGALFHRQLTQVLRHPVAAVPRTPRTPPQFVKETAPEERRPRIPMARIFTMLLTFGLSRFFR